MKVIAHWQDVETTPVDLDDVAGATRRLIIGSDDAAPLMSLRVFTLESGGHTPYHHHPFEHMNVILGGQGVIRTPDGDRPIGTGSMALILPDEMHQFRNTGDDELHFVCLVPNDYA